MFDIADYMEDIHQGRSSSGHFDTQSQSIDKTFFLTFILEKRKSEEMFLTDVSQSYKSFN